MNILIKPLLCGFIALCCCSALATEAVNNQITDSVTQTNVKVVGEAPSIAMGNSFEMQAQALAQSCHFVNHCPRFICDHQINEIGAATTAQGVQAIYSSNQ